MSPEDISRPGRPYGDLAIYYSLCNGFKVQMLGSSCDKRVLAIKINYNSHNFISFNVYFLCLSVSIEYCGQIALISSFMGNFLQDHYDSDCDIIISGDFNCNAESFINDDALLMLLDLFNSYDFNLSDDYYTGTIDYTFKCVSHNSFTWIDHIFISKPLLENLVKVSVINCGSNLSDHCILGFKASLSHIVNTPLPINPAVSCVIVHDWSSTNQNMYYANTSLPLLNLYSNLLSCGTINCIYTDCTLDSHICNLELFCCNLVNTLSSSSSHCIRQIKFSSQKVPWSNTL